MKHLVGFLLTILFGLAMAAPPAHANAYGKRKNMTAKAVAEMEKEVGDLDTRYNQLQMIAAAAGRKNPIKTGKVKQPNNANHTKFNPLGDSIQEVNENAGIDGLLLDGDMNLSGDQMQQMLVMANSSDGRKKRQMNTIYAKWTNAVVYYTLDSSLNTRKLNSISAAQSYISSQTCVRFVNSATAANRIRVFNGSGCYSYIGMLGGSQDLSLGDGCEVIGTVAHEFTHALGSFHMHQRYDRDNYLTVDLTYVDPSQQSNFQIPPSNEMVYFSPYEYGSMMQYSASSFTQAGQVSMNPTDSNFLYTMGNRQISFYDIYMINQQYNCNAKCPSSTSAVCSNGGYPNPNNCAACICPSGYAGTTCTQMPTGNGGMSITATTSWQQYTITLGTNTTSDPSAVRDTYMIRTDWITAPSGRTVQVGITGTLYNPQCMYGCAYNGIEFKIYPDQKASGMKMCCTSQLNYYWSSSLNPTPVLTFNRYYYQQFTVMYRYGKLLQNHVHIVLKDSFGFMRKRWRCATKHFF